MIPNTTTGRLERAVGGQLKRWIRRRIASPVSFTQTTQNSRDELLLLAFFGHVETGETAVGEPDVRDDLAVGVVVKVKKGTRPMSEGARPPFAQFAEGAEVLEESSDPLESRPAAKPRGSLEFGHVDDSATGESLGRR